MTDNQNTEPAEEQPTPEMVEAFALVEETINRFDPERRRKTLYLQSEDGQDFDIRYPRPGQDEASDEPGWKKHVTNKELFIVARADNEHLGLEEWWGDPNGLLRYFVVGGHVEGMPTTKDSIQEAAESTALQSLSETNLDGTPTDERVEKAHEVSLSAAMAEALRIIAAAFEEEDMGLNSLPATPEQIKSMRDLLTNCTEQKLPSVMMGAVALTDQPSDTDHSPLRPEGEEPIDFGELMRKIEDMLKGDDNTPPENGGGPPQN